MPSLSEIVNILDSQETQEKYNKEFKQLLTNSMSIIAEHRENRNVIFYASGFLQKPDTPGYYTSISHEDINGFMSVVKRMDWKRNLTLILHTPGGSTNAAETIVEYLHQKFETIETIVPTYAMSAGTMISLASNSIIMGQQSQLGPDLLQTARNAIEYGERMVAKWLEKRMFIDHITRRSSCSISSINN